MLRLIIAGVSALCGGLAVYAAVSRWLEGLVARAWRERLLRRVEDEDRDEASGRKSRARRRPLGRVELCVLLEGTRTGRALLRLLAEAGVRQRAEELLQWTLVGSVVGGAVLTLLTSPGIALVVLIAAFTCAYVRLRSRADTRRQLLRAQIPDLLDGLAQALRAGLSFPQAVSRMAADSPAPVASLVAALDVDLNCGRSIAEGFERFGQTAQLRELRMVSAAVSLMHRVGGNAPAMLEQTAGVIRQDLLLNRSLKTQTAQGRMSVRLVGSVPFVLVALMSIVLPDYLRSWLASGLGRAMFAAAIVLLLTGFLWVRKVVDIAV